MQDAEYYTINDDITIQDQEMINKSKKMCLYNSSICRPITCQVVSILSVLGEIKIIIDYLTVDSTYTFSSVIVGTCFLLAILSVAFYFVFSSDLAKGIFHQKQLVTFCSFIEKLYQSSPDIKFRINKFHYKTDDEGDNIKILDETSEIPFLYYSWKDISDRVVLSSELIKKYSNVKVIIKPIILFSDPISYGDYLFKQEQAKSLMQNLKLKELEVIKGISNFDSNNSNFYKLNHNSCINSFLMIFFSLIGFPLPYFIYIELKTLYLEIIMKKIISTRYNLREGKFAEKFKHLYPSVNINNIENSIEIEKTEGVFEENKPTLPSSQEIKDSLQYLRNEEVYTIAPVEQAVPAVNAILPEPFE